MTKYSLLLLLSFNIAVSQIQTGFEALPSIDLPYIASSASISVYDDKVIFNLNGEPELYALDFNSLQISVIVENKNNLIYDNTYTRVSNRYAITEGIYGNTEVYDINSDGTVTFVKDFHFTDIYGISPIDNDRFFYDCCIFSAYIYSKSNDSLTFLGYGTGFPYNSGSNFGFQGNIINQSTSAMGLFNSNDGTLISEYNVGTTFDEMAETIDNEWIYAIDINSDSSLKRHYLINPTNWDIQIVELQRNDNVLPTLSNFSYIFNGVKHYAYFSNDKIYINKEISVLSTNDFKKEELSIYPNPVNNFINIKTKKEILNIKIYTLLGKEVLKSTSTTINVSELSNGFYLLKAEDLNGNIIKTKFVKE